MGIIIFIMITIVFLIVCFETGKRFSKRRDLDKEQKSADQQKKLLEIEKAKLDLEKKKTELEKQKIETSKTATDIFQ